MANEKAATKIEIEHYGEDVVAAIERIDVAQKKLRKDFKLDGLVSLIYAVRPQGLTKAQIIYVLDNLDRLKSYYLK